MTPRLHALPEETIDSICQYLHDEPPLHLHTPSFFHLRLTCRALRQKSYFRFLQGFFSSIKTDMGPSALQRLLDISARPRYARHVHAVGLRPQGFYSGLTPEDKNAWRFKELPWDPEPNQAGPDAEHPWVGRKRRAYFANSWDMLSAANTDILVEALAGFPNLRIVMVGWDVDLTPFQADGAFERPQTRLESRLSGWRFPSHKRQYDSRPPHAPLPVVAVLHILRQTIAQLPRREEEIEFGLGVTNELNIELDPSQYSAAVANMGSDGTFQCPAGVRGRLRHLQTNSKQVSCLRYDRERGFLFDRTKITSFSGRYTLTYLKTPELPSPIPDSLPYLTRLNLDSANFWPGDLEKLLERVQYTLQTLALVDCYVRHHDPTHGDLLHLTQNQWYAVFSTLRILALYILSRLHIKRAWNWYNPATNNFKHTGFKFEYEASNPL